MWKGLTESEAEGDMGLWVKVRGDGLRVRCAACGGVKSSGCGFVAHEMVRDS